MIEQQLIENIVAEYNRVIGIIESENLDQEELALLAGMSFGIKKTLATLGFTTEGIRIIHRLDA